LAEESTPAAFTPSSNLRTASLASFLAGLTSSMTSAVWQPFVLSLGVPMSTLGMLESLSGFNGLVPTLVQPFAGWFSDRLGRKPIIAVGILTGMVGVSLYLIAGLSGDPWWLLPGVILIGASTVTSPALRSVVAEASHVSQRGMAYSFQGAAAMAPGVFAPALGGFIAFRLGFAPFFGFRLLLEALVLLVILQLLRETVSRTGAGLSFSALRALLVGVLVPPKELRAFFWAGALDLFAWGLGGFLLYGLLSDTFGFSTLQLGILSSLVSGSWAVCQLPIGKVIDRYGYKRFLVLSESVGVIAVLGWLFSRSFAGFAVAELIWGFTGAAWYPAQLALLANGAPDGRRAEIIGQFTAFRGMLGFPAPFIGGLLYEHFGYQAPLLANLVGVLVALVFILVAVKEPPPA
jgi:MFS family permease